MKSRLESLNPFDWTDTLLRQTEKQAVEHILVDYHDILARHRMDVGVNTELRWNSHQRSIKVSTAEAYHCQSTWKKTYLWSSPWCTNMESLQFYRSQNTRVPFLHRGNPTENYVSSWILGRSTLWERMITLTIISQSALCQMQHNTWQGRHYSASLTAPKHITACRWRTNVQWKCLQSILLAEPLRTKDLHKVSADL